MKFHSHRPRRTVSLIRTGILLAVAAGYLAVCVQVRDFESQQTATDAATAHANPH